MIPDQPPFTCRPEYISVIRQLGSTTQAWAKGFTVLAAVIRQVEGDLFFQATVRAAWRSRIDNMSLLRKGIWFWRVGTWPRANRCPLLPP